ncbi:hypothetical protein H206_05318 [Candidatus Electrothrix aarhusensis]|uniref:Uncharacterized protein n=1 Tax=Candidatus Electrothrix aarhusensis TaxID=1859131 RepID=A0A3S4TDF5_9BACT|nr:hypothetical protein H206_05318 [Candidatus Electrothrix aarhusensis]
MHKVHRYAIMPNKSNRPESPINFRSIPLPSPPFTVPLLPCSEPKKRQIRDCSPQNNHRLKNQRENVKSIGR